MSSTKYITVGRFILLLDNLYNFSNSLCVHCVLLATLFENKQEFDLFSVSQVGEKLRQIGQKSKRISEDEMGKRQPYGFGLGRR